MNSAFAGQRMGSESKPYSSYNNEAQIKEEQFLKAITQFKPPVKHESKLYSLFRSLNPIHEDNNEKAASVVSNLNRKGMDSNPFFNRELLKTSHGRVPDSETLFKLG